MTRWHRNPEAAVGPCRRLAVLATLLVTAVAPGMLHAQEASRPTLTISDTWRMDWTENGKPCWANRKYEGVVEEGGRNAFKIFGRQTNFNDTNQCTQWYTATAKYVVKYECLGPRGFREEGQLTRFSVAGDQ